MLQHLLLQSGSRVWAAFCLPHLGDCGKTDCAGSLEDGAHLPWLLGPCSFHALTCIIHLLFIFVWAIGFLWKGFRHFYNPVPVTNQNLHLNGEQHQKFGGSGMAHRARYCFLAGIMLSALLFLLSLFLGVFNLVLRWLRGSLSKAMHVELTTWIVAASWLILTIATNATRIQKKQRIPLLVRTWWIAAFILSLLSLVPNILSYSESHRLATEAWLESGSIFATAFLFVIAVFGQTGVTSAGHDALKEPLLGEELSRSPSQEASREEGPGVSPYATAGFFSLTSVTWLTPVIKAGYRKPLELKGMQLCAPVHTAEYNYSKFNCNWVKDPAKLPSLFLALVTSFWREGTCYVLYGLTGAVAGYVGPFLIDDFVEYLAGRRRFAHEGTVLILTFFVAQLWENIADRQRAQRMMFLLLRLKASLTAFTYRKGLRLSSPARQAHTTGEIINYVSVDVTRVATFAYYLEDILVLPLQVLLALLILYKVVGAVAALAALGVSFLIMLANLPLAKLQESYQDKVMGAKDERMKALTECLQGMRILKLQAWETQYLSKVLELRKVEYRHLRGAQYTSAATTFVSWSAPMFISAATFGTCVLMGVPLTAGRVLSALATFRVMQEPITQIPELISVLAQTKVSVDRLQKYFVEEELQEDAVIRSSLTSSPELEMRIQIEEAEFKWDPLAGTPTLQCINLKVNKGQRIAICGTVGSGKSSLLSAILGEIPKIAGTVKVAGRTAYVAQTAWIQSATIQENILFGMPMDSIKYKETVRVCALEKDMDLFTHGDLTIIGERGINLSGGQKQRVQLARAVYQDADIYLLDDPFSAVDAHTGNELFQGCILGSLTSKTVLYVTHQIEFLPAADLILVMRDGKVIEAGKYDELLQAGMDFNTLVDAHNEAMNSMGPSHVKEEGKEEGDVSEAEGDGVEVDEPGQMIRQLSKKKSVENVDPKQKTRQLVEDEQIEKGNTNIDIYWTYLTAVYKGSLIPLILLTQITFQVLQIGSNYWMASATPSTSGQPQKVDNKTLIVVYCILAFASSVFISARAVLVSTVGLLTAQKFFTDMLQAIFRAPMAFLDSTPVGRILARASTDQDILDELLLNIFSRFVLTSIQVLGIIFVMSQITWQIIILFVLMTMACVYLQRIYIKPSRDLTRLIGICNAPIIQHYGESIAGAFTIRAFGQDERFFNTTLELYDKYGRAFFHKFSTTQWLMFRMTLLSNCVFAFSLIYAVAFVGEMDPALSGLSVTYGLQLGYLLSICVWALCNLETRIISLERILQYTRVESEAPLVHKDSRPPIDWPSHGTIQLYDLQVRYNDHSPLVLHGLSCTFPGGQKIGVVGRTGSGKSTLIQALFRLVEPSGGRIVVDGVDISSIGLHDLRSKLSIIPQDPTLFEGTMRDNFDPLHQHSDAAIWEALDKCQLGDIVRAKEEKLDFPVNENGENWSVGQRQLVCLGRALLKHTTILALDEATASVDTATDGIIQRTIRKEFRECTVITVAHRIPTVFDSDRALVLSDGRIAEYDSPMKLLEDKNSFFYKLVSEYLGRSKSVNDLAKLKE